MAKVDAFLDALINYDKENIHPDIMKAIQPYLNDAEFEPEFVRSKSAAAAGAKSFTFHTDRGRRSSYQSWVRNKSGREHCSSIRCILIVGLCAWVINIIKFYEVYCDVEPKRKALAQANADLAQAQDKLSVIKRKVAVSVTDIKSDFIHPSCPMDEVVIVLYYRHHVAL